VSTENIPAFLKKADQDPILNEQVKAVFEGSPDSVAEALARLGAESGFPFTADEFSAALQQKSLKDAELSDVAGGGRTPASGWNKHPDGPLSWNKIKSFFDWS
jgi:predicted ribosomally synthesized peptide with nif11-like leader